MSKAFSMRRCGLGNLNVGQSTLMGPYRSPQVVSAEISRIRKKPAHAKWTFTQRKMLLVDMGDHSTFPMYLVTRTA